MNDSKKDININYPSSLYQQYNMLPWSRLWLVAGNHVMGSKTIWLSGVPHGTSDTEVTALLPSFMPLQNVQVRVLEPPYL
jgi:hypothetical protein